MEELTVQTIWNDFAATAPCAAWKTTLPSQGNRCYSPVFDVPCRLWHDLQFSFVGVASDSGVCKEWFTYLSSYSKKTRKNFKSDISVHLKRKHDSELEPIFFGEINGQSGIEIFIFSLQRSHLVNGGITDDDEVSLFFVFDRKCTKYIVKENSMQVVQPGIQSIQSLQSFSKDIEKLFDDAEHSNALLKCGDRSFSVNKNILSARSDVFAAMFRNKMSESDSGVVNVPDIDSNTMEQFLRFVYSGRLDSLCTDSALELYKAGDKYAVESLKRECASFMENHLSEDNVCEVLLLAHTFGDVELLKTTVSFTLDRAEFLKSKKWKTFAKEYPIVAVEVYMKYVEK